MEATHIDEREITESSSDDGEALNSACQWQSESPLLTITLYYQYKILPLMFWQQDKHLM